MTDIHPTGSPNLKPNSDILLLLEQQLDNFPDIRAHINTWKIRPSTLFLPQTIKQFDTTLDSNVSLVLDCLDFLDIVNLYSFSIYGNYSIFVDEIISLIVNNRTISNSKYLINKNATDDFIFANSEEAMEFLNANKPLLAIYIYSLISIMFFKS